MVDDSGRVVGRGLERAPMLLVGLILLVVASSKWWTESTHTIVPRSGLLAISVGEAILGLVVMAVRRQWVCWSVLLLGISFLIALAVMRGIGTDPQSCGCFGALRVGLLGHAAIALALVVVPACEIVVAKGK